MLRPEEDDGDVNLIDPRKKKIFAAGGRSSSPSGLPQIRGMQLDRSINVNPYGLTVLACCALGLIYLCFGGLSFSTSPATDGSASSAGQVSMKELLSAAIEAAKRGGREVKRVRELADIGEDTKGKTREGANNPVTDGDMLSHQAMYHAIKKTFPGLSVISEEHDASTDKEVQKLPIRNQEVDRLARADELVSLKDVDVWIDPLDATQEYTEKLLHYVTTMVCVAVKGKPVLGVIHKPFSDETAWGWAGNRNIVGDQVKQDAQGSADANDDLAKSRIIVSRSHAGPVKEVSVSALGSETSVTPAGGAGFKSWEVIKGNQDAYVHVTLIKKWDICAGNAILDALGGQLTDLNGDQVDYSGHPSAEPKNEHGVLATVHHHREYLDAFKGAVTKR